MPVLTQLKTVLGKNPAGVAGKTKVRSPTFATRKVSLGAAASSIATTKGALFGRPALIPFRPLVLARKRGLIGALAATSKTPVEIGMPGAISAAITFDNIGARPYDFDLVVYYGKYIPEPEGFEVWGYMIGATFIAFGLATMDIPTTAGETGISRDIITSAPEPMHDALINQTLDAMVVVCDFDPALDFPDCITKTYATGYYTTVATFKWAIAASIVDVIFGYVV